MHTHFLNLSFHESCNSSGIRLISGHAAGPLFTCLSPLLIHPTFPRRGPCSFFLLLKSQKESWREIGYEPTIIMRCCCSYIPFSPSPSIDTNYEMERESARHEGFVLFQQKLYLHNKPCTRTTISPRFHCITWELIPKNQINE